MQQDAIEATISETDVILMVFGRRRSWVLQRGEIPGAYSRERLCVLDLRLHSRHRPDSHWDIKGEALG
jgi:hypothetical protein